VFENGDACEEACSLYPKLMNEPIKKTIARMNKRT